MMNIQVLDEYRKKKKLTGKQLSKQLGLSPTWYSKILYGKAGLRPVYIEPLAKLFGISSERLAKELFSSKKDEKTS